MAKVELTSELLARIAGADTVRAALRAKARRILPRAQRVAASAGAVELARELRVEEGVRPGSKAGGFRRPYARISARITEVVEQADREATLSRRQILRRAANA